MNRPFFFTKIHLQKSEHSGLIAGAGSDVPPPHTDVALSKCTAVTPFWPLFRPLYFPTMHGFLPALLMSLLKYVLQSIGGAGCQWHSSLVLLDLGRTGQCTRAIRSLSIPYSRGRTGRHSHFVINFFLIKKNSQNTVISCHVFICQNSKSPLPYKLHNVVNWGHAYLV